MAYETAPARRLFADSTSDGATDTVTVAKGSEVDIAFVGLPEGVKVCLNGIYQACDCDSVRYPLFDKCNQEACVCGPCPYTGTLRKVGDYELRVCGGDLGEAQITAITRQV